MSEVKTYVAGHKSPDTEYIIIYIWDFHGLHGESLTYW